MSEEIKQQTTDWLRRTPSIRGSLVRGIRFVDETFVSEIDSKEFRPGALEQAWRSVADTFQVLSAQQLPPTRLTWIYDRAVLHCVRRTDGAILGIFMSKQPDEVDPDGLDRLLGEFQLLQG